MTVHDDDFAALDRYVASASFVETGCIEIPNWIVPKRREEVDSAVLCNGISI